MMEPDTLSQPGRGLGFADGNLERRFHEERHALGLNRSRTMIVLGALVVGGLGVVDVALNAVTATDYAGLSLMIRFLVVAPVWLAMLVSTFLPGHPRRADLVNAGGSTLIAWALTLMVWLAAHHLPGRPQASHVIVNTLAVLMISAFALPMRFPAVVVMTALTLAGAAGLFLVAGAPSDPGDPGIIVTTLAGVGVLVLVVCWYRETAERRTFVQREQVRQLNAELARLNAEKNEFMAIAAHDLRAPLASVRGLAEQLRAGRLAAKAEQEQALAAIGELSGRMLALVSDYLGAHIAESGALPVRIGPVDLAAAARDAAARSQPVALAKGQMLDVEAARAVTVRADPGLVAQVADNFVSNALKFSPAGTTVRLRVAVAADGRTVRLEVADEGPGIPAGEQAGLFRKFGRAGTRPTAGEASHGLGLAVARRLAEAMDGRVGCHSAPGAGATFWLELPVA